MSRLLLPALLAVAFITLLPGNTFAQQGTLTDDSTYPQGVGSNQVLVVQGPNAARNQPAASAFVKFKLTGSSSTQMGDLPSGTPGKDVKKATLRLFVSGVTTPASFDVFPITGAWDESGTTDPPYDTTKPVIKGVQVTSANSFLAFDITALVKQWLDYDPNNPA
ncbi:MAG: DNRLRE domain-containing protein, partial [Acidobacteria bacterium]|nr:DNRLRE domain-containing protein [Acidobacteriota bacterium]